MRDERSPASARAPDMRTHSQSAAGRREPSPLLVLEQAAGSCGVVMPRVRRPTLRHAHAFCVAPTDNCARRLGMRLICDSASDNVVPLFGLS
jgi:hypothetical protein